jgi:hypothetical protein
MKQLSADEVYEGLLGFGLFSERLPPIFTSKPFYDYAIKHPFSNDKYVSQFIVYNNMRNINIYRVLGIPTPFAYENLCSCIRNNWQLIQEYFLQKTGTQKYKISRVHLRKLASTNCLFKINYDNWKIDGTPEPDLIIGKRFLVKTDISNCFPSIYTHSLCWALVEKKNAQKEKSNTLWYNKLDSYTQKIKGKETHGLIIGPHVSNLLSEIILCNVDSELEKDNYEFIRHIDDYECYVTSRDDAEKFLLKLRSELRRFDLLINDKKTEIVELPVKKEDFWVSRLALLKNIFNSHEKYIDYKDVRNYFDLILELMHESGDNGSVILYALKVLSAYRTGKKEDKKVFTKNAIVGVKKIILQYVILYPYLVQFLEQYVIIPFDYSFDEKEELANHIYEIGSKTQNYEAMSYGLLFSLKNGSDVKKNNYEIKGTTESAIKTFDIDQIMATNDCVLLLLAYYYAECHRLADEIQKLKEKAISIYRDEEERTRFWLFIYEVLNAKELRPFGCTDNTMMCWSEIKNAGISFVEKNKLFKYGI